MYRSDKSLSLFLKLEAVPEDALGQGELMLNKIILLP